MQVYKAFFKIILKNLNQIMIYIVVFISLAIALANTNSKPVNTNFTDAKVNVAFINNDTDSVFVKGFKSYLGNNVNFVDIPDETQKLQDALFFRQAEYIVRVPKGFTEGILKGETVQLEKTIVPGSTSSIYIDSIINKYLNTAKLYTESMENLSQEQLVSYINKDLALKTDVNLKTSAYESSNNEKRAYYFNYMAYALFSVLILGVSSVMIVFNNTDLKKRNLCSPIKLRSMNFQMILGNLSFAVITWVIMILASFIMYRGYMFSAKGLLFLLNSLIFTFAALSISYLIGNVIKSKTAMSAAANVVSLGSCFISGVFVPQALLGKNVLRIASFTPNYWYVKSNNSIVNMTNFDMQNLEPIFLNMLIIIGFAVAVLAVTLVVIKQRRVSN
ncbi:ABC transporter permease [Clostridium sp. YIM B02515]|uniref:ABC transporter permease n=1 Tax=Clostridium rhizosphaerae TaxID=2803861 RepID=A0ABS1T4V2_9CLOT|nr:ABC transporter permease [Clostridium rhizosphaerae]MBL4934366.1 ABC transporter permease [Clostridium rhizosphaerae]